MYAFLGQSPQRQSLTLTKNDENYQIFPLLQVPLLLGIYLIRTFWQNKQDLRRSRDSLKNGCLGSKFSLFLNLFPSILPTVLGSKYLGLDRIIAISKQIKFSMKIELKQAWKKTLFCIALGTQHDRSQKYWEQDPSQGDGILTKGVMSRTMLRLLQLALQTKEQEQR